MIVLVLKYHSTVLLLVYIYICYSHDMMYNDIEWVLFLKVQPVIYMHAVVEYNSK